jgi:hypothetical protein
MREFTDANVGRLNVDGFIPKTPHYADGRDRPSMRMNPIPPDALLLHDAPVIYSDHLYQDFSIPDPNLPRRELVQALHTYASNFYAHAIPGGGEIDYCSMDGSALVAIAKLLEATVDTTIGETGDLAFTEGASFEETGGPKRFYAGVGSWGPSVLEKGTFDYWELLNSQRELTETGRAAKKARLAQSGNRSASGGRSSRKACAPCYKQRKMCDHGHPCARCIALKRVDHCIYESDSGISRSRSRGRSNCKPCYKQKRGCDRRHPCATCIKYGREDQCIYDSDSQDEEFNSKVSLSPSIRTSRSDSANSSRSNAQMSTSDNLEEQHSRIGADEEESSDEGDEVKVEAMELRHRGRPVTRSSPKDHSVSPGRRSKTSWSGRTPPTFGFRPEEKIERDLDNLSSESNVDSRSQRHDPRTEGARLNAEKDMSQSNPDLSVEQLAVGHGSSFDSDDKDALMFDNDLGTSFESDSSEGESHFHIRRQGSGKDVVMDDSENESELKDENCSSSSDDDKGTSTKKA